MFSQLWNSVAFVFAAIINAIYTFIPSYGWAIIIFTIITRLIMLPLTLKQLKSSEEIKKITPLIRELDVKYKNDPQKKAEEQMRLYREHNIKPAAGCLPMLIQFPLIILIYQVVQRPLTYIMNISQESIAAIQGILQTETVSEFQIIHEIAARGADFAESLSQFGYRLINFKFLGLDLLQIPDLKTPSVIWLIPALVVFSQWLSMRVVMPPAPKEGEEDSQAMQFNSTFFKIMPWMTGYISFVTPAALGVYWIASSLLQAIQQLLIKRFVKTDIPEPTTPVKVEEKEEEQTTETEEVPAKKHVDPGKKNAKNKKKK